MQTYKRIRTRAHQTHSDGIKTTLLELRQPQFPIATENVWRNVSKKSNSWENKIIEQEVNHVETVEIDITLHNTDWHANVCCSNTCSIMLCALQMDSTGKIQVGWGWNLSRDRSRQWDWSLAGHRICTKESEVDIMGHRQTRQEAMCGLTVDHLLLT